MLTDIKTITKGITAIIILTILTGLLLSAGCSGEKTPQTDVIVFKTDSNGTVEWITSLDTGMQDSGDTIIETSDGGYLIAGGISDNPEGQLGRQVFPRLVKLDKTGTILWDTVLNSTSGTFNYTGSGSATTVLEKTDGDFLAGLNNGWVLTIGREGTVKNITALENHRLHAIGTHDGGTFFVGENTMKFDTAGNLQWEIPVKGSTLTMQMNDGRYLLDNDLEKNDGLISGVTCLSPNGTILWTYELGNRPRKTITSFHESSPGIMDITYTYRIRDVEIDLKNPETTIQVNVNPGGDVIAEQNLAAAGPLARTPDNGYVFVAIPFYDSGKFTTDYSKNTVLHIVRLSADGRTVWDRPFTSPGYNYPLSVITTRDGGYVALVGADFHYQP